MDTLRSHVNSLNTPVRSSDGTYTSPPEAETTHQKGNNASTNPRSDTTGTNGAEQISTLLAALAVDDTTNTSTTVTPMNLNINNASGISKEKEKGTANRDHVSPENVKLGQAGDKSERGPLSCPICTQKSSDVNLQGLLP